MVNFAAWIWYADVLFGLSGWIWAQIKQHLNYGKVHMPSIYITKSAWPNLLHTLALIINQRAQENGHLP